MATKKRQRDGQKRQRFGKAPPPALRFCLFVDKDGQPPVFVTENRQKIELFSKNVALHKTAARNCAQCTVPGGRFIQFLRAMAAAAGYARRRWRQKLAAWLPAGQPPPAMRPRRGAGGLYLGCPIPQGFGGLLHIADQPRGGAPFADAHLLQFYRQPAFRVIPG